MTTLAIDWLAIFISVSTETPGVQPEILGKLAAASLHFEDYGLGEVELRVTDFAAVRTYRLISDQRWGGYADALETIAHKP